MNYALTSICMPILSLEAYVLGWIFCKKVKVFPFSSPLKNQVFFFNVTILNSTEIMKTPRKSNASKILKG